VKRLESLDVLRGFDMFFIFLPDPAPCVCAVALAAFGFGHSALAEQFDHVAGAGLHFYDLIFPLFLFISGVTWPFSCASQLAKGAGKAAIALKILRRAVLLFVLGAMVQTKIDGVQEYGFLAGNWEYFRVWSVIGRIGIAWGATALLTLFFGVRARAAIISAILLAMWYLTRFHCDWIDAVDINYLTTAHRPEGGFLTINMIPTAMLGIFAGEILHAADRTMTRKAKELAFCAAGLVALGCACAFLCGSWSIPVHKGHWSTSFVLVAGGISFALLALFYWMVDIKGWKRWGFFFKVIGMNAITIYVLVRTILPYEFEKAYFFGGVSKLLPPAVAELVEQVGLIALGWSLLYYLYKKNVFLRV